MCNILGCCTVILAALYQLLSKKGQKKSETSRGFLTECYETCHMASLNRGLTALDACSHIGETEGELPQ